MDLGYKEAACKENSHTGGSPVCRDGWSCWRATGGLQAKSNFELEKCFQERQRNTNAIGPDTGELHLKGKYFRGNKIRRRAEELIQLKPSTGPRPAGLGEGGSWKFPPSRQSEETLSWP